MAKIWELVRWPYSEPARWVIAGLEASIGFDYRILPIPRLEVFFERDSASWVSLQISDDSGERLVYLQLFCEELPPGLPEADFTFPPRGYWIHKLLALDY